MSCNGILSMRLRVLLANKGLLTDLPPHVIPAEAATEILNLVPHSKGFKRLADGQLLPQTSSTNILSFLYWPISEPKCYVLAHSNSVTTLTATNQYTITPGGLTDTKYWDLVPFHNLVVLNNGKNEPRYWPGSAPSNSSLPLPNWPSGKVCNTIAQFKRFLVALGIDNPMRIRWSTQADPGSLPDSWAINDPTKDSGEVQLDLTAGALQDLVLLRDVAYLYATNSIWKMEYVGSPWIFRFSKVFDLGVYAKNQAVAIKEDLHAFVSMKNVYLQDGVNIRPLLTGRVAQYLEALTTNDLEKISLHTITPLNELWICMPTISKALVWNWDINAFGYVDLQGTTWIAPGRELGVTATWDSTTDTWDSVTSPWDPEGEFAYIAARGTQLYVCHRGPYSIQAHYTHEGLLLENNNVKTIHEVWPYIEGPPGTRVRVSVGAKMTPYEPIVWAQERTFTIGASRKVNFFLSGRMLGIKFLSLDSAPWTLSGYEIEYKENGRY